MRATCPHCQKRFDIGHVAILQEAARLAQKRKGGGGRVAPHPDAGGNVLSPADTEAKRLRDEAIRRRLGPPGPG